MLSLVQDLRYSVRAFRKSPGLFATILLTLAVAIGGNSTVFTWVEGIVFRPLAGVRNQEHIVAIAGVRQAQNRCCTFSYPDYLDYSARNSVFDGMVGAEIITPNLSTTDQAERILGQVVTGNYFDVLGVKAQIGRTFASDEDAAPLALPVAVISDAFWKRRFGGDPSVVGSQQMLNGRQFTIVGVTPPEFRGTFLGYAFDIWVPAAMEQVFFPGGDLLRNRDEFWLEGYARLKPGVTIEQAQSQLGLISKRLEAQFPASHRGFELRAYPLWKTPFGGLALVAPGLALAAVVVSLVLLIACSNVAGLLLTRALSRRREMAIRFSLGATRARIVRQVLTESMLLSVLGGGAGLLLATSLRESVAAFFPAGTRIVFNGELDWRVVSLTAIISIVTGILFGLGPALRASRGDTIEVIKENASSTTQAHGTGRLRQLLMAAQIALTVLLLIGACLFIQTLRNRQTASAGFDRDRLVLASFDLLSAGYNDSSGAVAMRELLARAEHLPGAASATLAWRLPLSVHNPATTEIVVPGYVPRGAETPFAEYNFVGPNYLSTMRTPLISGRDFSSADNRQAAAVAIVNETMARRYWPDRPPIGARVRILGKWAEIIGVAKDTKYHSLTEDARPYVYLPILQYYTPRAALVVRAHGDPNRLVVPVERLGPAVNRRLPMFNVSSMQTYLQFSSAGQKVASLLFAIFGVLALALACVGLYGIVTYTAATRTRELGIRMALGGTPGDVRTLVMGQGLRVAVCGALIGAFGALGLTRFAASQLYGVSATDPATFAGAAIFVMAIAAVASFIPAWKAARLDVTAALRSE